MRIMSDKLKYRYYLQLRVFDICGLVLFDSSKKYSASKPPLKVLSFVSFCSLLSSYPSEMLDRYYCSFISGLITGYISIL